MTSRVRVLRPTDSEWQYALRTVPSDVYHQAGYHLFEQHLGHGEAQLAIVEEGSRRVLWPYLLRPIPGGHGLSDVTSVYGYPGPIADGVSSGDGFLLDAWQELRSLWNQQKVVSVFTRFHPLLDNAALCEGLKTGAQDGLPDGVAALGATISVDCTLSDEATMMRYHRALRQHLSVSRRKGMLTREDAAWDALSTFTAIYTETMERNRAADEYMFTAEDFDFLRCSLPGQVHLHVTTLDGEVTAAGLFTECDGIVEAHLVGSRAEYRRLSPTKVLLDDVRRWARDRGNRMLHLGGGRGGREDSLFRFKSEFSPDRHPFAVGRWVLNPDAYTELVGTHTAAATSPPDYQYFPAYRAPLQTGNG